MKNLVIALSLFIPMAAFSQVTQVECQLQEVLNAQESYTSTFVLTQSEDPHGSIQYFTLTHLPDFQGMMALVPGDILVLNIHHEPTGFSSASHSELGEKGAHLHFLLSHEQGVTIDCTKKK